MEGVGGRAQCNCYGYGLGCNQRVNIDRSHCGYGSGELGRGKLYTGTESQRARKRNMIRLKKV